MKYDPNLHFDHKHPAYTALVKRRTAAEKVLEEAFNTYKAAKTKANYEEWTTALGALEHVEQEIQAFRKNGPPPSG